MIIKLLNLLLQNTKTNQLQRTKTWAQMFKSAGMYEKKNKGNKIFSAFTTTDNEVVIVWNYPIFILHYMTEQVRL